MDDEKLALMVMYERFIKWMEAWENEQDERREMREQLSKWSGRAAPNSTVIMMALAFCAGADAAADLITGLNKKV